MTRQVFRVLQIRRHALLLVLLAWPCALVGQESAPAIRLGMSTALSGPNQYLGHSVYTGMARYFDLVNRRGGVGGRRIELLVLDDRYEGADAARNTRYLIDEEQVLAIVGNVGTPTAEQATIVTDQASVVFYGGFTGASILRDGVNDDFIYNYRASYRQEMDVIIEHILAAGNSPLRIAFLLQEDGYGCTGYKAATAALAQRGFSIASKQPCTPGKQESTSKLVVAWYPPNQLETQQAIKDIIDADRQPDAVVIVGAYQPSAHAIRFLHRLLPTASFYNLSFAGPGALATALPGINDRVYMTQVVALDSTAASDQQWPADLVEREGFLAAEHFVHALETISGTITRQRVRDALDAMSPLDGHQASDYVALSRLHDGAWRAVE